MKSKCFNYKADNKVIIDKIENAPKRLLVIISLLNCNLLQQLI